MLLDWLVNGLPEFSKPKDENSNKIIGDFQKLLPRIMGISEVIDSINYDETIKYFKLERPSDKRVQKGVIIRQNHYQGTLLIAQLFLDKNDRIVLRSDGTPYGKKLVLERLDAKLDKSFGTYDLIFVELESNKSQIYELSQSIFSHFSQQLQEIVTVPDILPVMTYESAIRYFVTERPEDTTIEKGAILRQPHSRGQLIIQVFLNNDNKLVYRHDRKPYGRQIISKELDDELLEAFDGKNIIIVE
ncbi:MULTISPECIES: hypothetical protein [unclassified Tolypothrix]|uniref:hypothetical protein n=1 Tax=unclassified Tolypothrix TaxID=2649714 RepID=UPI0005EAC4F2|nr:MULTISPECIES: hypothetical protein [unclassified Tolypothrix]BAY93379.1 hypothetical protein NIES3275_54180 [Microchaete diplosiphon NIES-3275]EKE99298.1 hypothetical protein FDUTEX481_10164 [Tolypothrix sp. PCC 7601]MBE9087620.1 hypothetical protein [Tolypothrix sp. LEGE 11397]UYD27231.1 hypothetical protein HGR01_03770 [Tolypothrix sp. PCC 7712]UYD36911.1 hypothetical protein HG267_14975 [Tolypothrix sp. PCC 7601]